MQVNLRHGSKLIRLTSNFHLFEASNNSFDKVHQSTVGRIVLEVSRIRRWLSLPLLLSDHE